jgi:2-methylcitrate dehydratase
MEIKLKLCFQFLFTQHATMEKQLQNVQIAGFSLAATFEQIGDENIEVLKRHLLDSLGSLLYATTHPTIHKLVRQIKFLSKGGPCKVPLLGGLPYDRAAQLYTALIRFPDFMDNFMGKEATCHPSDNLGPLLSAIQYKDRTGKAFLAAMAVAYQVQCRLVLEIPVMKEGIDHTLLLAYSMIAGVSRLFDLNNEQAAHALAIAGCSIAPLVTSRASYTSEWKGFASSADALNCINISLLAKEGMTGPVASFEGPKGFKDVFNMKLDYNWKNESFELISKCVLKKYNAEVHSQSAIEAICQIKKENNFRTEDIESVDITTFLTAFHIIGGGAYGDRENVHSKEQADHSLFYLAAIALIEGEVYPEHFLPETITRKDVQALLKKVHIDTSIPFHKPVTVAGMLDPYTIAYPDKMKTKVEVHLAGKKKIVRELDRYPGFFTSPFTWPQTEDKFLRLCSGVIDASNQQEIIRVIKNLENEQIDSLLDLIMLPPQL